MLYNFMFVFKKYDREKHILWIHFGENFIDIWGGVDFGPYSSQSFNTEPSIGASHQRSVHFGKVVSDKKIFRNLPIGPL
jgi:hypothetical protein